MSINSDEAIQLSVKVKFGKQKDSMKKQRDSSSSLSNKSDDKLE